jgi:L-ascorbate metabolism protein UlaG (beta-lactamase superfamily)
VAIEYIAHACFRVHSATGTRVLIDPFASRVWLGYDFPRGLAADAILITHPHYDHDGGEFQVQQENERRRRRGLPDSRKQVPWAAAVRALRGPGTYTVADIRVSGIRGKHAEPYGTEFGQRNTIWLIEAAGLRIAHLGDNGPLTETNVRALGRGDVLMIPIDSQNHLLKEEEIQGIRAALRPRILIPIHYRHPDLEIDPQSPKDLGSINPWLVGKEHVTRLSSHRAEFSAASLGRGERIVVFRHSPQVRAPERVPDGAQR